MTMSIPPLTLSEVFEPKPDELAVLSVAAVRTGRELRLAHASLVIVPPECARASWAQWRQTQEQGRNASRSGELPAELTHEAERSVLSRTVLTLSQAEDWFASLQQGDLGGGADSVLPVTPLPAIRAKLTPPEILMRVHTGTDIPVSGLLVGLGRPARALLWRDDEAPAFPELGTIEVDGLRVFTPSFDLVGMQLGRWVDGDLQTPRGIVVARAERRAWIVDGRGASELTEHVYQLGWDPELIDLADLELSYVARRDGAVVTESRARLQEMEIDHVRSRGRCEVTFQALGPGLTHEARLYSSSGELLDEIGPHALAERITMEISIVGESGERSDVHRSVLGGDVEPLTLRESLSRQLDVQQAAQRQLEEAAQRRTADTRAGAIARIRSAIERARSDLLIQDPYFGQRREEWELVAGLAVPVRVLTRKIQRWGRNQPHRPVLMPNGVEARCRPSNSNDIHERVWIWEGGGLIVGSSPSHFGKAPVHINELTAAEAAVWRAKIETLWLQSDSRPVPILSGSRRRRRDRRD